MYRQTPLTSGFVGYSGGGARALVDTVDDEHGMQEMKGSFMHGEARQKIESPQNYGFTSVVLPAKKGKDGKIEECAEAYINFLGGNRTFAVAGVMDDRRHRPWGLKPGENAQYDDIGQMTLMRRNGLFLLTLDSEDESQSESGGGDAGTREESGGNGQGKKVERMASLRHVEKKKQERPKGQDDQEGGEGGDAGGAAPSAREGESGGNGQSSQNGKDHKHEGESVNTEVRCTAKKIEILDGETVVGVYDKEAKSWTFKTDKITVEAEHELTLKCENGKTDIWGKPINFNGGGPTTPPFTVPG